MHHHPSKSDDGLIRCEQPDQDVCHEPENQGEGDCYNRIDDQCFPDAPADAFHLSGSVILADEGRHSHTERIARHPENLVRLAAGRPGCHIIRSEPVDSRLQNDIRDRVRQRLHHRRDPDLQNPDHLTSVDPNLPNSDAIIFPALHQALHHQDRREQLAENRRQSSPEHTHFQTRYKQKIESDVCKAGHNQVVQRPL